MSTRLHTVPLDLAEANKLVKEWHRHHKPDQGQRWSLGCIDNEGVLHGAAIVGRPRARMGGKPRDVLEVTRLVTDGTKNACSILYAAAARAGKAMGFRRIQTYILDDEPGTSLLAAGWTYEGPAGGGEWSREGRLRDDNHPTSGKGRWAKALADRPDLTSVPERINQPQSEDLFGEATA